MTRLHVQASRASVRGRGSDDAHSPEVLRALAPARSGLLAEARAQADALLTRATDDARATVAQAEREAAEVLAQARRRGEADGAAAVRRDRVAARRAARAVVLREQRAIYDSLLARSSEAVADLLADPGTRARLAAGLRAQLGPGAVVHDTPDGGLVATTADGRGVDASAWALMAAALDGMDLEVLWTPTEQ